MKNGRDFLKRISITVDVETDWGGRLCADQHNCQGIEKIIPYILDLFEKLNIKSTFFISGEILTNYYNLIQEIHDYGHEIGSHGHIHRIKYDKMSKEAVKEQVEISKNLLKDLIGVVPIGFRSPQLRTNDCLFEALSELNFKYDSSTIRGYLPTRYNNLSIPNKPFRIHDLLEIPISTMPFINIPMGLLSINALGFAMFKAIFDNFDRNDTYVFYFHPFDLILNKSKNDFGSFINNWYNFRSRNVQATFELLLNYLSSKGTFIPLNDVVDK